MRVARFAVAGCVVQRAEMEAQSLRWRRSAVLERAERERRMRRSGALPVRASAAVNGGGGDAGLETSHYAAKLAAVRQNACEKRKLVKVKGNSKEEDMAREKTSTKLVLMRHGESMFNRLKLFTGDVDVPLTDKGIDEALIGGQIISDIQFDVILTSCLTRSRMTAMVAMTKSNTCQVPVYVRGGVGGDQSADDGRLRLRKAALEAVDYAACQAVPLFSDPALNERCYGELQGLSKDMATEAFGEQAVKKWRRSIDTRPPGGESLKETAARAVACFVKNVEPLLKGGKNVLVVAHGNSLRTIIAHVANLTDEETLQLHVQTAEPLVFEFDGEHYHFEDRSHQKRVHRPRSSSTAPGKGLSIFPLPSPHPQVYENIEVVHTYRQPVLHAPENSKKAFSYVNDSDSLV